MSTCARRRAPLFGTLLVALAGAAGCAGPGPSTDAGSDASERPDGALDEGAHVDADAGAADLGVTIDAAPDAGFVCTRPSRPARDAGTRDGGDAGSIPSLRCNGATHLCDRSFDRVAYATTHNAMSNRDDGWTAPNQEHGITRQLRDGVRGMMLDAHEYRRDAWLCHGDCLFGKRLLAEGLCDVTRFLDENPGEVVTLIFESYISGAQTEEAFRRSGLLEYVHAQPRGAPWPSLRTLIEQNERVVVFTTRDGGTRPWLHHYWDYAFENPYAARTPGDLSCAVDRGAASNALFVMNHFLTAPFADVALAQMVNPDPFLTNRVRACTTERGRAPNFVTVDFYDVGALFSVVDRLNAAEP